MAVSPQVKMLLLIMSAVVLLAVGIFLMMLWTFDSGLCHRNQFAKGDDAGARELIDKGWLPKWFPAAATDVREAHNQDSNRVVVRFKLDAAGVDAMTSGAKALTRSAHEIDVPPAECGVDWWERASLQKGISEGKVDVYEVDEPDPKFPRTWYIAHREPEVWMWQVPGEMRLD